MKLSVIIPCYNFENYLQECVDSVLAQKTNFPFEVLIGDDCSTDGSLDLLEKLYGENKQVKILSTSKNSGPFDNIRMLLREAKGEYISYLDGDDFYILPNKLQIQVDFLDSNPEFSMHSTAYRGLKPDGTIIPHGKEGEFLWFSPKKEVVTTDDLLERNWVTFGRTFRNSPDLLKEWIRNCPYLDWGMNFEISLLGKIKCENICTGMYRHNSGTFSIMSEKEKGTGEKIALTQLRKRYFSTIKRITIIDCYVRNARIEAKLGNLIKNLKSHGEDILLISNTVPSSEIIQACDYFIYDHRNQLFEDNYTGTTLVDFHIHLGDFSIHNLKPGMQRHGLSVLINLFNALNFAQKLGYKFFQRFEADDLFGSNSITQTQNIFYNCVRENKKGCFFFNEGEKNISFHYFLCEIDYFLEKVPRINSEKDFQNYLISKRGNLDFVIVEEYVYQNIEKDRNNLIIKDGGKMNLEFPDTSWNTETSGSNLDPRYKDCVTGIYKIIKAGSHEGFVIMSYNYSENLRERKIICKNSSGEEVVFNHRLESLGSWAYHPLPMGYDQVDIYDSENLIMSESTDQAISYLQF